MILLLFNICIEFLKESPRVHSASLPCFDVLTLSLVEQWFCVHGALVSLCCLNALVMR